MTKKEEDEINGTDRMAVGSKGGNTQLKAGETLRRRNERIHCLPFPGTGMSVPPYWWQCH